MLDVFLLDSSSKQIDWTLNTESSVTIYFLGLKIIKFFVADPGSGAFFTRDPGIRWIFYPGSGMEKLWSGMNIPDTQHCSYVCLYGQPATVDLPTWSLDPFPCLGQVAERPTEPNNSHNFIFLTFLLLCCLLQCVWWESTVKKGSVAYAWYGPRFRIHNYFLWIRIRKLRLRMRI